MTVQYICCPNCKRRFNDHFEWGGERYCYPCYGFGKPRDSFGRINIEQKIYYN